MIHRLTSGLYDFAIRSVVDRSLPACRVVLPGGRAGVAATSASRGKPDITLRC